MDKFRIDSHKLMYHVDRLNSWLQGKNVCPIYVEISPSGACNHRCVYCALDFVGYQPRLLETSTLKKRLTEMGKAGVKSIMYAGEGEPLLHKDIGDIIRHTHSCGIDVAVTSNAVLFTPELAEKTLAHITWFKVSINAATPETYSRIHRTNPSDFQRVMRNMAYAAGIRRKKGYACALGMQIILLPENYNEVTLLAKKAKAIGMDYLVVKPYSQHPFSKTTRYKNIKYEKYLPLAGKLSRFNTKDFSVIFRVHAMKKWDQAQRTYEHCLALPFWTHIDAGGNVWACSAYLAYKKDNPVPNKFLIGNIYENTFRQILEGSRRRSLVRWAARELDTCRCRVNCRMDEVNRYLWDVTHPPEHVNFI
jgi:GTP 3',8-cyclase